MHTCTDTCYYSNLDRRGVVCFRVLLFFGVGGLVDDPDTGVRRVMLLVVIRLEDPLLPDDDRGDDRLVLLEAGRAAFAIFCLKISIIVSPSRRRPLNS